MPAWEAEGSGKHFMLTQKDLWYIFSLKAKLSMIKKEKAGCLQQRKIIPYNPNHPTDNPIFERMRNQNKVSRDTNPYPQAPLSRYSYYYNSLLMLQL